MTVIDRHDTDTLRRGAGPAPLTWATLPVPEIDPIDLFAVARTLDLEAVLWLQPAAERAIVGIGRAWGVETDGPERFSLAAEAWRTLLGDASGPVATRPAATSEPRLGGPILLGGLGFTGQTPPAGDPWAPFGSASLVVPSLCLERDEGEASVTVAVGPGEVDEAALEQLERQWDEIVRRARKREASRLGVETVLRIIGERPDRVSWDRTVGLFAGAVGRGRIDKVVLARRVIYRAEAEIDVVAALRHLADTAPESTTFAFTRGGSTFLGATPERLVRTVGRSFETVAIAGSVERGRDTPEDVAFAAALLASEKDREEHAVVVDMLRSSLSPIAETMHIAATPVVLPLRHLQHLVTPVTGTLRDEEGLLALAQRLHPTPAVGGAPRDVALSLIDEHEGFDRGWYAGPIGWLGADGDGELMVALRCGVVTGNEATLFAGCGIVADSDPTREWEESRLKLRTMTTALGAGPGATGG